MPLILDVCAVFVCSLSNPFSRCVVCLLKFYCALIFNLFAIELTMKSTHVEYHAKRIFECHKKKKQIQKRKKKTLKRANAMQCACTYVK